MPLPLCRALIAIFGLLLSPARASDAVPLADLLVSIEAREVQASGFFITGLVGDDIYLYVEKRHSFPVKLALDRASLKRLESCLAERHNMFSDPPPRCEARIRAETFMEGARIGLLVYEAAFTRP